MVMEDMGLEIEHGNMVGMLNGHFLNGKESILKYADEQITPTQGYEYIGETQRYNSFDFQETQLTLRYAHGEQTVTFMGIENPLPTSYPIIHLNLTSGIGLYFRHGVHQFDDFWPNITYQLMYSVDL